MNDATPTIEAISGPYGIRITDPIEKVQFTLLTPGPVDVTPSDADAFAPPVDTAASVSAMEFETPYLVGMLVRDGDMNLVAQCTSGESVSLDGGTYYVEVSSAKVKLYLKIDGGMDIEPDEERVHLSFRPTTDVQIGVRSFHESPAATIRTTTAPEDVATALSYLGSALKTTTCERSFPTLRGHPPLFELGSTVDVPDAIERPSTGVTIEVPNRLDALFPVASLAYYFGAEVEIGDEPVLVADDTAFHLDEDDDFEETVSRVLRQAFLLDCITRTEGLYTVDLHERQLVESAIDIDFAALYNRPLDEQLRTYLDVPFEALVDAVPTWKLTADVVAEPDHVPALPFLAGELAVIRCPTEADLQAWSLDSSTPEVTSLFRRRRGFVRGSVDDLAGPYRSADNTMPDEKLVFEPPSSESIEQTYIGPGIPLGASEVTVDQLYRRLEVEPGETDQIEVLVVCNDPAMSDENAVSDIYGVREWIDFDITPREGLTTNELTEVLKTDADFLHYIGHVDNDGIRCTDGHLDAHTLSEVNVGSFLLNACQSYSQGRALVEAGALGGVVTLTEVLNRTATEVGRTVAHLLNHGFSLLSMLDLLEKASPLAHRYMVVGDGNISIASSKYGSPSSAEIERISENEYAVHTFSYPSKNYHMGSLSSIYFSDDEELHLKSGRSPSYTITARRLEEYLNTGDFPVIFENRLYWAGELSVSDLD